MKCKICGKECHPTADEWPEEQPSTTYLKDALVGSTVAEFVGRVAGMAVKDVKVKGKAAQVTKYQVVSDEDEAYEISKFGSPKDDVEGEVCKFKDIQISEYKDKRQYLAKSIEVL